MTRWSDASGFFLLETMGVAAVLIVMAGALMLFRQGVLMEEQTRFEAAATCLAESELAHIEYRAAAGTLTEARLSAGNTSCSHRLPLDLPLRMKREVTSCSARISSGWSRRAPISLP